MLDFELFVGEDWHEVKDDVLRLEKEFPWRMRADELDYSDMMLLEGSFMLFASSRGRRVGNAVGHAYTEREIEDDELTGKIGLPAIYLASIAVESEYRNKGIGYDLMREFLDVSRKDGYVAAAGHFLKDSLGIANKLCAEEIRVYRNWCDTHRNATLCVFDLKKCAAGGI